MMSIPKRAADRISQGIKNFQTILESARKRDVNESDTVTIVVDIFSDVFGYDKYTEITQEYVIRGTYCDLAIKIDNKIMLLIEVKAIGLDLKESYIRQAVNYAINEGVEWVLLTNGICWYAYYIQFGNKPVTKELVLSFNFLELNPKNPEDIEKCYTISKEGLQKSALEQMYDLQQTANKFTIAALIQNEKIVGTIKRELNKLSPGIKIDDNSILNIIQDEVLKREVVEGEKAGKAVKKGKKDSLNFYKTKIQL